MPFLITSRPGDDILKVQVFGFWNTKDVDAYFRALEPLMAEQRRRTGRARVLVDRRKTVPQSGEILALSGEWLRRLFIDTDSAAIIVSTSLLRMQLKRVYPAERMAYFETEAEAEAWLQSR